MAFDITSVLKGVSGPDTAKEQLEYIDIDLIDPDPNNFYSLEGLDELAGNIELIGLQQPIRVRPGRDGRYIVVSGHRRRAAILLIRDGGSEQFQDGVPCIVDLGKESPAMRELRLIFANASTRVMGSAEISKQAERVEELLYQLKEEGIEFPGRMRDHVAEACKVSKTKLARLHAIRKNLVPELLARFDRGEMPEETAYQLSRLPDQAQAAVDTCLTTGKKKNLPFAYQVEHVANKLEDYTRPASCRSHAGGPDCTITNVHVCRSIWEPYRDCWNLTPNTNSNGICCRDCNDRGSCSWACKECKDRRALDAAVEKEKAAERAKAEEARKALEQKQFRKQRQKQAQLIMARVEALGLKDDELPPDYDWKPGLPVKNIKRWADGKFDDDHFYDADVIPTRVPSLRKWTEILECSADYLLGLTEDPTPATERGPVSGSDTVRKWRTGDPKEPGLYVVIAGYGRVEMTGCTTRTIKFWDGGGWYDEKTHAPLGMDVYRWYQLPEEE